MEPPSKKQRLTDSRDETSSPRLESLSRQISPPPTKRQPSTPIRISPPFQLTKIRDLPASSNQDAVSLPDLLGDPLISECWEFNFLHDIEFLMKHFDEDTRHLVKVHIIHGFWKREDPNRLSLQVSGAVPHPYSVCLCLTADSRSKPLDTRMCSFMLPTCRRCSAHTILK